ncbi:hypothetical protein CEXT_104351 [Caerostris extrusa]|uniref:Uncharacterized protein n=1 Tax=Caerostris extrusa TaxID=172846 RepID=A0AAV4RKF7_CAEEX|nr:hypothetical protein CEXT_104351 [Caerostris extrusa]
MDWSARDQAPPMMSQLKLELLEEWSAITQQLLNNLAEVFWVPAPLLFSTSREYSDIARKFAALSQQAEAPYPDILKDESSDDISIFKNSRIYEKSLILTKLSLDRKRIFKSN